MIKPDKSADAKPAELTEVDALMWENLQLKAEMARREYQALVDAYNAKIDEFAKRYGFDPASTRVDLTTRKITRQ